MPYPFSYTLPEFVDNPFECVCVRACVYVCLHSPQCVRVCACVYLTVCIRGYVFALMCVGYSVCVCIQMLRHSVCLFAWICVCVCVLATVLERICTGYSIRTNSEKIFKFSESHILCIQTHTNADTHPRIHTF